MIQNSMGENNPKNKTNEKSNTVGGVRINMLHTYCEKCCHFDRNTGAAFKNQLLYIRFRSVTFLRDAESTIPARFK
uniref:Uncharacterized protein n=1 Tax=Anguilla anguilla TaxID=7936 RepID=A0A0E9WYU1_ANGAN